ncbi:helix-turn-helix transcriptional regulator [Parasedimentitalea huanghaiensis]|uniref:HTH luxR-type domain-containing protein n=1 Tax=Parasedimentitalea huanghaiensis TaxID=2682100 RepID=A0A6L6WDC4_9RHOB|nr:LuxR family transcriptional regulator [Zongyanglinia huanghaiensis]MVO15278.1 hypothetical protein [Zongyanglinia huanghaiensis]
MKKNELIDSLNALLSADQNNSRWLAAERIADQMGVKSILVAEVEASLKEVAWISTNMPVSWMEEYLGEDYLSHDPLVEGLSRGPGRILLHCGQARQSEMENRKVWAINHGLKSVGYETLHCSRFGESGGFGRFVSLAFEHERPDQIQSDMASKDLLAALLASTLSPEVIPHDLTYHTKQHPPLSIRQREVLSLLAEGMMTSRIAETLGISETAVSQHFAKARKSLGANTREHALALAMSRGLISL